MVGNPAIHVSSLPTSVSSCMMISLPGNSLKFAPLSFRNQKKINKIRATSADGGNVKQSYNSEPKNPLAVVFDIPRRIWKQTLGPLSDFGFGRKSVWEGGVGLFLVSGTILFVLSMAWLRAFQINSKFRKYTAVFEFAQASGISTGTPVRIRGVTVGNVTRVNPSLKSIEAVVEVCFGAIIQLITLICSHWFSYYSCKSYHECGSIFCFGVTFIVLVSEL